MAAEAPSLINNELKFKLGEIIREGMERDGVLPKRSWNPNSKTVAWLKERGFNMGHQTKWAWSMAYGPHTPVRGHMEGFVVTHISWTSPSRKNKYSMMEAWMFVPEEMANKILVLGCP